MQLEIDKLLNKIELYENIWLVIQDGIPYTVNPKTDTLILVESVYNKKTKQTNIIKTELDIKEAHQAYLQTKEYLLNKHNFKLKVWVENLGNCYAFSTTEENRKIPNMIKLCVKELKNIDGWKFSLAHEVGHFDDFLINKIQEKNTSKTRNVIELATFVLFMTISSTIWFLLLKSVPSDIPSYGGASFIFLSFYSLFYLCDYFFYHLTYYQEFINSHEGEYYADKFALDFFPNINLKNTFLNTGSLFLYADTHPSHIQRICALKFNIKTYLLLINPFYLKHSDTFKNRIAVTPRIIYLDILSLVLSKTEIKNDLIER